MRHMGESQSLNELEEAFNGQAMNFGLVNMIKIRDELSPRCDNRLLEDCDLLVF